MTAATDPATTPATDITDVLHAALNMTIQAGGQLGRLQTVLSDDRRTLTVQLIAYSPFTVEGDRVEQVQLFIGPAAAVATTATATMDAETPAADPVIAITATPHATTSTVRASEPAVNAP